MFARMRTTSIRRAMRFRDVWDKNSMKHFKLTPADMCRGICMVLLTQALQC